MQDLDILIDTDEVGYLQQLFTEPLTERPTVFFEIIQEKKLNGFTVENLRNLFGAIEFEQAEQGKILMIMFQFTTKRSWALPGPG